MGFLFLQSKILIFDGYFYNVFSISPPQETENGKGYFGVASLLKNYAFWAVFCLFSLTSSFTVIILQLSQVGGKGMGEVKFCLPCFFGPKIILEMALGCLHRTRVMAQQGFFLRQGGRALPFSCLDHKACASSTFPWRTCRSRARSSWCPGVPGCVTPCGTSPHSLIAAADSRDEPRRKRCVTCLRLAVQQVGEASHL